MWLGWPMLALSAILAGVFSIYHGRRRKWIARLEPGTVYRPVNAWYFIWYVLVALVWNCGMHRIGTSSSRWVALAVIAFAIALLSRRLQRRNRLGHSSAE